MHMVLCLGVVLVLTEAPLPYPTIPRRDRLRMTGKQGKHCFIVRCCAMLNYLIACRVYLCRLYAFIHAAFNAVNGLPKNHYNTRYAQYTAGNACI